MTVKMEGGLTVVRAGELKEAVQAAITAAPDVALDFRAVDDADLSCLQILCSACRTCAALGKGIRFKARSGALDKAAADSGFTARAGCFSGSRKRCLLPGGGEYA